MPKNKRRGEWKAEISFQPARKRLAHNEKKRAKVSQEKGKEKTDRQELRCCTFPWHAAHLDDEQIRHWLRRVASPTSRGSLAHSSIFQILKRIPKCQKKRNRVTSYIDRHRVAVFHGHGHDKEMMQKRFPVKPWKKKTRERKREREREREIRKHARAKKEKKHVTLHPVIICCELLEKREDVNL